jgi:hypothetical protein
LAYADWLEENASAAAAYGRDKQKMLDRARLIRVQTGLAKNADPDRGGVKIDLRRRVALGTEEGRLRENHRGDWDYPLLRDFGAGVTRYRMGFPFEVEVDAESFIFDGEGLFAAAPVRALRICRLEPDHMQALAGCSDLLNLTRLDLRDHGIGPEGAQALAASPHLRNLTYLGLWLNDIGDEGARALAGSPLLGNLTRLELAECDIGDRGARALAGSPYLANLTKLEMGVNRIGPRGARALADSPYLRLEAKASALNSAGYRQLARQVQNHQTGHQAGGPG